MKALKNQRFQSFNLLKKLALFQKVLLLTLSLIILIGYEAGADKNCSNSTFNPSFIEKIKIDLAQIKERGKLIAIIGKNPNSLFLYKGRLMGYEYDLLSLLAQELKVELQFIIAGNEAEALSKLKKGEGDIIACDLNSVKDDPQINFTTHYKEVKQVLIQRKNKFLWERNNFSVNRDQKKSIPILNAKEIYVTKGTNYFNLSEDLKSIIPQTKIVETSWQETASSLIARVASGEIDYTITNEDIARSYRVYYNNIKIETEVGLPRKKVWAIRNNSPELLTAVNHWIKENRKKSQSIYLYNKYFKNIRISQSDYYYPLTKKLSPYDHLIKEAAKQLNWDWRLLAAQAFQESRFNPKAISPAGAKGLMQLMDPTAKLFGGKEVFSPEENIQTAIKYLQWLEKLWSKKIVKPEERIKFVLASYNAGQGHVIDAMHLAEKFGKNPYTWEDNVAHFLLKKSDPNYYNDPIAKSGYCRGKEPVQYVEDILNRFEHYNALVN
ncbi:transglycosylase SLT domain-containing protein [Xanthovirga aplysinae]|uniref:transglycosylase SLT domain-containing protein n=1 Tax=Xanthovirga aplysinae TaxID=2529853 RepID=UPI0012BBB778|nr:transglycosylase SLT domain-containing protein [Xanthovirga aplysinae]MTI32512.1 transporter substrate-binding domain-containing protein [Xanthovirga aplysinae]